MLKSYSIDRCRDCRRHRYERRTTDSVRLSALRDAQRVAGTKNFLATIWNVTRQLGNFRNWWAV
jgi:hypothetical protein